MRWYNTNGDEIQPIKSRGVGELSLSTPQPTLAAPTAGVAQPASSGSKFNVDSLTAILGTGLKVAGTIQQQRQQSGAALTRQSRIAACGRKPLGAWLSRRKSDEYNRCVQQAMSAPIGDSKSLSPTLPPPPPPKSNTMLYVGIVVALALVGGAIYVIKKNQ